MPSLANCERCAVRHLCAAYWDEATRKLTAISDGEWFDYEGKIGMQNGQRSWWVVDPDPTYLIDADLTDGEAAVAGWWFERWGRRRAEQEPVRESMRAHRLVRPLRHAARVPLPSDETADVEQSNVTFFVENF